MDKLLGASVRRKNPSWPHLTTWATVWEERWGPSWKLAEETLGYHRFKIAPAQVLRAVPDIRIVGVDEYKRGLYANTVHLTDSCFTR